MRTLRFSMLFGLFIVSLFLWGCAGTGEDTGGEKLLVYSGRSESLVGPLVERFQAETGIAVEIRYGSTAEMAATILEEGANSPADVYWAQDPGGLGALAEAGRLSQLPADVLDQVAPGVRSPDGLWVGVSGRARVVVFNTDVFGLDGAGLPEDLWAFTDPAWRGRIGWSPTNGSFQVMVTAMRTEWGEEQARAWLAGILANQPVEYPNNTSLVAGVAAREVEIGFTNHYYLYRFLAEEGEGFQARNHYLNDAGPGSLVMISGAGILTGTDNRSAAEAFLRFLLAEEAQAYFASETYEYPMVAGTPISPTASRLLKPLDTLRSPQINLADLADLQGTIALLSDVGALP